MLAGSIEKETKCNKTKVFAIQWKTKQKYNTVGTVPKPNR